MRKEIQSMFQKKFNNTDYSKLKDCTIVIPTYNRSTYLRRILGYYDRIGIPLSIIVADSSSDGIKDLNREICGGCRNLMVQYLGSYKYNLNPLHKIIDAVEFVSTPFVVLCADDDFIIPSGMIKTIDFLSVHSEYKVAQGRHFYFLDVMGEIQFGVHWMGITIDDASAEKRLIMHEERYYPTFYALYHTEFLKQIFTFTKKDGVIPEYGPDDSGLCLVEMYPTWLTAIYSRIGIISNLYSIRDRNSVRQWDYKKGCAKDRCKRIDPDLSGTQSEVKPYLDAHLKRCLMNHLRDQTMMDEYDAGVVISQLLKNRRQKERSTVCLKVRLMEFMRTIIPNNRTGDLIRRAFHSCNRRMNEHSPLAYLLNQELIDDNEYQDCLLIQESIIEHRGYS